MILTLIDKILKINGNIIIHDFFSNNMIKTKYKHAENVYCYKQDIIKLFTFNPLYIEIYKFLCNDKGEICNIQNINELCIISILHKFEEDQIYIKV